MLKLSSARGHYLQRRKIDVIGRDGFRERWALGHLSVWGPMLV